MNQVQTGFEQFFTGIFDSLLLFLVIPLSIPIFIGYHLLFLKRFRNALISFSISFIIAMAYLIWVGPLATVLILAYITVFYILLIGPFWLLEKGINWYEKKYIYDKYMKKKRSDD